MARSVAVTFDYRCPFAYNGNLAVINAIRGGNDIDFRFVPFSLDQVHVGEGEPPMWERDPEEWGTGMRSSAVRHRGARRVPRQASSTRTSRSSRRGTSTGSSSPTKTC